MKTLRKRHHHHRVRSKASTMALDVLSGMAIAIVITWLLFYLLQGQLFRIFLGLQ